MAKLYTFPNGLNDNRTSLFNTNSSTLSTNSSGGTSKDTPGTDAYQVEKGGDYIRTYGNPLTSDGMYMEFKQTIGNHYWMTSIFGAHKQQDPTNFNYSPLYDDIFKGVRFNWRKYDNGSSSKHKYRLHKMGVVYRSSNTGTSLKDFGRDGSQNLFNFGTTGHTNGGCELKLSSGLSHVIGFYFQLETEGKGSGSTGGSWIHISDLQYIGTNTSREAILSPRTKYSTRTPATPRPIWTG